MHLCGPTFLASLTNAIGAEHGCLACGLPADAVAPGCATAPAWMRGTGDKFRLPFRHAGTATECLFAVKVRRWAGELLSAPFAFLGDAVAATRVWLSSPTSYSARRRTILLCSLTHAECRATVLTCEGDRRAPPRLKIASARTEATIGPPVLGVEWVGAGFAIARLFAFHAPIIPRIELEERYCELAARRLQQAVLTGM